MFTLPTTKDHRPTTNDFLLIAGTRVEGNMSTLPKTSKDLDKRERIVKRVARELHDGFYVNLGIGLPTLIANYVPPGMDVILQSENGMLGIGPYPLEGCEDADLINAGKETVSELAGTRHFLSGAFFAVSRGRPRGVRRP